MVRLKTRYILFEILYPDGREFPLERNYDTKAKATVSLRQPSPADVGPKQILYLVRASLQKNFGDYGSSMGVGMTIRYFSGRTSTGILRCSRANAKHVAAALAFISSIEGERCIFNVVGVSGSIKKSEDRAIELGHQLSKVVGMGQEDLLAGFAEH